MQHYTWIHLSGYLFLYLFIFITCSIDPSLTFDDIPRLCLENLYLTLGNVNNLFRFYIIENITCSVTKTYRRRAEILNIFNNQNLFTLTTFCRAYMCHILIFGYIPEMWLQSWVIWCLMCTFSIYRK